MKYFQNQGNNKTPNKQNEDLVNERVNFPMVMLIGANGEQLGVMSSKAALQKAIECDLDLFCVAPNAKPPVCKLLNYGKYRFEAQKKAKENKRNQALHAIETKEVQLTPQIGAHDLETKSNRAKEFLSNGDKVKVVVRFKGRQLAHPEVGEEVLNKFIDSLKEVSTLEKPMIMEGKFMVVTLISKFKK